MKYAHQCLVKTSSLITIGAMLAVPLPAMAVKIHGAQAGHNVALGNRALMNVRGGDFNTALGWDALRSNSLGSRNTAIGMESLTDNKGGNDNTAIGSFALTDNTTGQYNTASGSVALYKNTTGSHNTASGGGVLSKNTEGSHNTASGAFALSENVNGNHNTASGVYALKKNIRGGFNTAMGSEALKENTYGKLNTASGYQALTNNTEGSHNTAAGFSALSQNITGSKNTASGSGALMLNAGGDSNTAIGYGAGGHNNTGSNNIFIGFQAGNNRSYQSRSNTLVIGNGSSKEDELITGDFAAHTVNINGALHASGNLTQNSDARLKKDIQPLTHALDAILQLQGKTYRWKEDTTFANKQDIGLVAQEVEKVFPELVAENEQGYKGIAYSKLTAVLIEAIKEQQGQMTTQQDQIASLEKENTELKTIMAEQMDALLARVAMLEGESLAAN